MNKFLLTIAAVAAVYGVSTAQITIPGILDVPMELEKELTDWTTYGNDAEPNSAYVEAFSDYATGPWYHVVDFGGVQAAYSVSTFNDGSASDQWLISPEFTVTDDNLLLRYEAVAFGARTKQKFKILLSEGGTAKEDFTEVLKESNLSPTSQTVPFVKGFGSAISGYKGKKVRVAFVNSGNKIGMLGFRNITVGQYSLSFDEASVLASKPIMSNDPYFSTVVRISTPLLTEGLTATLKTDEGQELKFENATKLTSGLASQVLIKFDEVINFNGKSSIGYTLTVAPNMEGVEPAVVKGVLNYAEMKYDVPIVIEEATGTWCQNCPYGIAFMSYYVDKYNGLDGNPWVIGIAVHNSDPMTVTSYDSAITQFAYTLTNDFGYPSMIGNRSVVAHPIQFPISGFFDNKSFAKVNIARVDYNPAEDGTIKVDYATTLSYSTPSPDFNAAMIIIENDVKGTTSGYNQATIAGISNMTESEVTSRFGKELVPYFKPLLGHGNLIPCTAISYEEVARGIFPSFSGKQMTGVYEQETPKHDEFKIVAPNNIMDPKNIKVIVILTDRNNGHIIAADEVGYENFNKDIEINGVESVVAGDAKVLVRDGYLVVNADSEGRVALYSVDGRNLVNANVETGENVFRVDGNGMVVVRVATASGVVTKKVVL